MKVSIRKFRHHGNWRFELTWFSAGRRKREKIPTLRDAKRRRLEILEQTKRGGEMWFALSVRDRASLGLVLDEMEAAKIKFVDVWEDWKRGRGKTDIVPKKIGVAIPEIIAAKETAKRRPSSIQSLRIYLKLFARGREDVHLHEFTTVDIETWFDQRGEAPSTKLSNMGRLSALFAWAVRRGHAETNPVAQMEKPSVEAGPVIVLNVRNCAKALVWARRKRPAFLGWLSLSLLAGLRPEEAGRISWSDVDLENGIVTVDAAAAKVRERRVVHLTEAALSWLRYAHKHGGRLPLPKMTRRNYLRELRDFLGFDEWPADVLRKTAASHLFAAWQSAGKVAAELGTSERMLFRHYREVVTREQAQRWLGLVTRRAGVVSGSRGR